MTKEEIGAILKQFRLSSGMTQKEVAEKIGRKQQIIGHWETGYAQPDANTLFTLCDLYGTTVDEAFGFIRKHSNISITEYNIIKKYRDLDSHGKDMVDTVLNKEYTRWEAEQKFSKITTLPEPEHLLPNAAHSRTDISETEKTANLRQQEEDIMDDENF